MATHNIDSLLGGSGGSPQKVIGAGEVNNATRNSGWVEVGRINGRGLLANFWASQSPGAVWFCNVRVTLDGVVLPTMATSSDDNNFKYYAQMTNIPFGQSCVIEVQSSRDGNGGNCNGGASYVLYGDA